MANASAWCPHKQRSDSQCREGTRLYEDRGRACRHAAKPRGRWGPLKLEEWGGPSQDPQREHGWPCRHLDLGLPSSRTVGEGICPVSHQLSADVTSIPRKLGQLASCWPGRRHSRSLSLQLFPEVEVEVEVSEAPCPRICSQTSVHGNGPENSLSSPTQMPPGHPARVRSCSPLQHTCWPLRGEELAAPSVPWQLQGLAALCPHCPHLPFS